jgi:murein endopeptidase
LVEILASEKSIGKIFIEPHLKTRLKLTTPKIRFHGCRAVRHDDHIHVQLI